MISVAVNMAEPAVHRGVGGPTGPSGQGEPAAVEVRTRFDGTWAGGYTLVDVDADGRHRVRRCSDGAVLPVAFDGSDIRIAGPSLAREAGW